MSGLVMRSAGKLNEVARPLLLITAQPLAHRGDGGLIQTSGGFDAMLTSVSDEAQAMVGGTLHFSHQSEVGSRHGCGL
jgi:hypothetical protein